MRKGVIWLFFIMVVAFAMPACENAEECEGVVCSSAAEWCCGNAVMRCIDGKAVVSRQCDHNEECQTYSGPDGSGITCAIVREP